ncbi:MAG: hypothetical protein V4538_17730 [Bacteroidota bacterium]
MDNLINKILIYSKYPKPEKYIRALLLQEREKQIQVDMLFIQENAHKLFWKALWRMPDKIQREEIALEGVSECYRHLSAGDSMGEAVTKSIKKINQLIHKAVAIYKENFP